MKLFVKFTSILKSEIKANKDITINISSNFVFPQGNFVQ